MRNAFFFFVTLIFSLSLGADAYSAKKIVVAWESWPPYQFKDSSGNLSGLDVEITRSALEAVGYTVEFQEMPWIRQLISVANGEIDVVMAATVLPERKKYAYFSLPYRNESYAIYLEKGGNDKYELSTIEDIVKNNITLGIVRGYYYGEEFENAMKNPKFKRLVEDVANDEANIRKLSKRRINAFIMDKFAGVSQLKAKNLMDAFDVSPLTITTGTIHVMFSIKSTSPHIVEAFNEGLIKIQNSGQADQIINSYF